jgi:hypothetical protein
VELVRLREYLADIFYITPHLYPLPSRGEEHSGALFSKQFDGYARKKRRHCQAGQSIRHRVGYDRVIKKGVSVASFPLSNTTKEIMARMSNVKT